jgi:hypothetical protein
VYGDAGARLPPLRRCFQQKFSHPARAAEALHQIEKRTVLKSTPAPAIFFAASQILPDIGGPQQSCRRIKLREQRGLPILQGGYGSGLCSLNHKLG